jgi:prepilin-type N-terminal cleavage/methylation domain-containing protein
MTVASHARSERGYSITELMVVLAVLGLIVGGILTVQQQGQAAYVMGSNRVETQQNARVALDLLVRELRSATAIVTLGSATDITFTGECNADGVDRTVRYQLSGTTLNRTCNGTTTALIGGVQSFDMTYWSAYNPVTNTGTTTTVPANVRIVRVRLTTRSEDAVATGSIGDRRGTMESAVRLRNQ